MVFAVFDVRHGQRFALAVKAERPDARLGMGADIGGVGVQTAAQNRDLRLGGVVLVFHTGAAGNFAVLELFEDGGAYDDFFAQDCFQLLLGDVAGAQQHRLLPHHRNDGGLDTDGALAAVEDQRQPTVHIRQRVGGVGGAGLAGQVGAGRGKRHPALADDRLHHRVGRHTHAHGIQPGTGDGADLAALGHDHRQGSRPEGGGQLSGARGHLGHDAVQHLHAADVYDEGVILGAALRLENFFHSRAVAGVGGNAVDRLGGQGYQLPFFQKLGSQRYRRIIDRQNLRFHGVSS